MPHPGQLHLVVPSCMVVRDRKILIMKRAMSEIAHPGEWQFCGGKIDRTLYELLPKDTVNGWYNIVEETLKQEVRDESGLEIETPQYIRSFVFIRPDDLSTLVLRFWAQAKSGEVKLSKEHTEYAWVTPEEARKYALIDGLLAEIEHLGTLL